MCKPCPLSSRSMKRFNDRSQRRIADMFGAKRPAPTPPTGATPVFRDRRQWLYVVSLRCALLVPLVLSQLLPRRDWVGLQAQLQQHRGRPKGRPWVSNERQLQHQQRLSHCQQQTWRLQRVCPQ